MPPEANPLEAIHIACVLVFPAEIAIMAYLDPLLSRGMCVEEAHVYPSVLLLYHV